MRKIAVKIQLLTVTTLVLLLNGLAQNATAAPSEVKGNLEKIVQYRQGLPQQIIETFTTQTIILTSVLLALGKGGAIEREQKPSLQKSTEKSSQKTTSIK